VRGEARLAACVEFFPPIKDHLQREWALPSCADAVLLPLFREHRTESVTVPCAIPRANLLDQCLEGFNSTAEFVRHIAAFTRCARRHDGSGDFLAELGDCDVLGNLILI